MGFFVMSASPKLIHTARDDVMNPTGSIVAVPTNQNQGANVLRKLLHNLQLLLVILLKTKSTYYLVYLEHTRETNKFILVSIFSLNIYMSSITSCFRMRSTSSPPGVSLAQSDLSNLGGRFDYPTPLGAEVYLNIGSIKLISFPTPLYHKIQGSMEVS